jgi:hypothetical protein
MLLIFVHSNAVLNGCSFCKFCLIRFKREPALHVRPHHHHTTRAAQRLPYQGSPHTWPSTLLAPASNPTASHLAAVARDGGDGGDGGDGDGGLTKAARGDGVGDRNDPTPGTASAVAPIWEHVEIGRRLSRAEKRTGALACRADSHTKAAPLPMAPYESCFQGF